MPKTRRLFIIGGNSQYSRDVITGVDAYCRTHGRWEYHIQNEFQIMERVQSAIQEWKADGLIAYLQNDAMRKMVVRLELPVVNCGA